MLDKVFKMDNEVWRAHANPWSVWTRFPVLPLFALAVWSRTWIGAACWIPVLILIGWTWWNPRFFKAPENFNSWASKAVLGEQIWMERKSKPIARHHDAVIRFTWIPQFGGLVLSVWGLVVLHAWATVFGVTLVLLGKILFLDRMVWIYHEKESLL